MSAFEILPGQTVAVTAPGAKLHCNLTGERKAQASEYSLAAFVITILAKRVKFGPRSKLPREAHMKLVKPNRQPAGDFEESTDGED
jgi:hypothetical protein